MVAEGFSFYETPFDVWLSYCLYKIHNKGGHPVPLAEYRKSKEECEKDLISKLEEYAKEQVK